MKAVATELRSWVQLPPGPFFLRGKYGIILSLFLGSCWTKLAKEDRTEFFVRWQRDLFAPEILDPTEFLTVLIGPYLGP